METIKVLVISANTNNWYKVGEEHTVAKKPLMDTYDGAYYPVVEYDVQRKYGVGVEDCEIIINEQKENNMKQEKRPHKHQEFIVAWAAGKPIQWLSEGRWIDVMPESFYFQKSIELRYKPEPEFPKTTFSADALENYYLHDTGTSAESVLATVNMALQHFITSGQMDAYIKERDNA